MTYLIPQVGSRGKFTFASPFDAILDMDQEYTVSAVRSIKELEDSEIDPYRTIYEVVGLTEDDFSNDVYNNIPIVILVTTGGDYINIPATSILSQPDITGLKYQEKILAISLGNLPIDYDASVLEDIITSDVYTVSGIESECKVIPSSAIHIVSKESHDLYIALISNRATVTKSYKTRYLETLELYNKMTALNQDLQNHIKKITS